MDAWLGKQYEKAQAMNNTDKGLIHTYITHMYISLYMYKTCMYVCNNVCMLMYVSIYVNACMYLWMDGCMHACGHVL